MLIDLEKAFDRVWTTGLFHKMIVLQFPPIVIIHSYLHGRMYQVTIDDKMSDAVDISAGVPQGSVLGPILFRIYTYDLPRLPNQKIALYADDTLIYAHAYCPIVALAKIQNYLHIYERYLSKWKLTANSHKSSVTILTKRTNRVNIPRFPTLFNIPVSYTRTIRYLIVILDKHVTFKDMSASNANITLTLMKNYRYILLHRGLAKKMKLLLYKLFFGRFCCMVLWSGAIQQKDILKGCKYSRINVCVSSWVLISEHQL